LVKILATQVADVQAGGFEDPQSEWRQRRREVAHFIDHMHGMSGDHRDPGCRCGSNSVETAACQSPFSKATTTPRVLMKHGLRA
jgi:hypothetical protein